jgi:hypothetical protein
MVLIIPGATAITPPIEDFSIEWLGQNTVTTSGINSAPYVLNDATVLEETSAASRYEGPILVNPFEKLKNVTFQSENEAIATVDSSGYVISQANGTVTIKARYKHLLRKISAQAAVEVPSTRIVFQSYNVGTLGRHIIDSANALLAVSQQKSIYLSGTIRNTDVWTGNVNLTGIAYSNSRSGDARRGATLISPRHVIMANHYALSAGDTVSFVDTNGNIVERTVDATLKVATPANPLFPDRDIRLGRLNTDVPVSISWYKLFPDNWQNYLTMHVQNNLPLVSLDQQRKVIHRWRRKYIAPAWNAANEDEFNESLFYHDTANIASEAIVGGDSGQPNFHIVNGELLLVGTHTWSGAGYTLSAVKASINTAMATLGGGYSITEPDISGFTSIV